MDIEGQKQQIITDLRRQEELLNIGNKVKLQAKKFANNCNQIINSLLAISQALGKDASVSGLIEEINSILDHYKDISTKGSTFYDSIATKMIQQSTVKIQNLKEQRNSVMRIQEDMQTKEQMEKREALES